MWSVLATQILVCAVTAALVGFDIWLASNGVPKDTYSQVIHRWALLTPLIPYAWGVLAGHFFWSRSIPIVSEPGASIWLGASGVLMIFLGMILRHFGINVLPLWFVFVGIVAGRFLFPLQQ
jgi:hypothetical protein